MSREQENFEQILQQLKSFGSRIQELERGQLKILSIEKDLSGLVNEAVNTAMANQRNKTAMVLNERFSELREEININRNEINLIKQNEKKTDQEEVLRKVTELVEDRMHVIDNYIDPLYEAIKEMETKFTEDQVPIGNLKASFFELSSKPSSESSPAFSLSEEVWRDLISTLKQLQKRVVALEKQGSSAADSEPIHTQLAPSKLQPTSANARIIRYAEPPQQQYFSRFYADYRAQITLFCIYCDTEQDEKAYYTLVEKTENLQYAFNFPDSLRPAIDFLSSGIPEDLSKIRMEPGMVTRDGDAWKITKKLEIKWS